MQDESTPSKMCPICGTTFSPLSTDSASKFALRKACTWACSYKLSKVTRRARKWGGAPVGVIPLGKARLAYVDPDDWERCRHLNWTYSRSGPRNEYAHTEIDGRKVYLHRYVMGEPNGNVDHEDGDGLNCRRGNLRVANQHQNLGNSRLSVRNSSGFKGVYWFASRNKWVVRCRNKFGGYYEDIEDAARVYDRMARQAFGEFARLNFPEGE